MMVLALVAAVAAAIYFLFWTLTLTKENLRLREKDIVLECELEFSMGALERALDKVEDQKEQLARERKFLATFNERLTQIENELEDEEDSD